MSGRKRPGPSAVQPKAKAGGAKKGNPAGGYRFGPNPLDTTPGFRDALSPPVASGPSAVPGPGRGRPGARPPVGSVRPTRPPVRPPGYQPDGGFRTKPPTAPGGGGSQWRGGDFGQPKPRAGGGTRGRGEPIWSAQPLQGRMNPNALPPEKMQGRKLSVQPTNRKSGRRAAPPGYRT